MTNTRRCEKCEKPFVDDEGWKRKCIVCWKTEAKYELTKSDKAFGALQDEFARVEKALEDVKGEKAVLEDRVKRVTEAYKRVKSEMNKQPKDQPKEALSQERLRQLVRLCHPDLHKNSDLSTDVTKWLLSMRDQSK